MTKHKPPHPGEFIKEVYLSPFKISSRTVAEKLLVSPSTLGRSPESWLSMQDSYNLWHARNNIDLSKVKKLTIEAA
jgi:plasmid maintenance system antidote protein VapI